MHGEDWKCIHPQIRNLTQVSFTLRSPCYYRGRIHNFMSFIYGGWFRLPGEQYKCTVSLPKSETRHAQ